LASNEGGLWKEILESKYGGWRNLKEDRRGHNDFLWWKDLKLIWKLEKWGSNFGDCLDWEIGNGKSIKLWEDRWASNESLKFKFPRLFSLSVEKDVALASCRSRTNNGWEWSLAWRRNLYNWEKVQVKKLLEVAHNSCPVLEKFDRWIWKEDILQEFSVNSAYGILRGGHEGEWSGMFKLF